jgi:hypothetical protein
MLNYGEMEVAFSVVNYFHEDGNISKAVISKMTNELRTCSYPWYLVIGLVTCAKLAYSHVSITGT